MLIMLLSEPSPLLLFLKTSWPNFFPCNIKISYPGEQGFCVPISAELLSLFSLLLWEWESFIQSGREETDQRIKCFFH